MELSPKEKNLLLIVTACTVFSVIFTEALIAGEHDHDCIGEGCPICLQIAAANNFHRALKLASLFTFFAVFLAGRAALQKKYTEFIFYLLSPVKLKVRFNS